jgi:hypothetical protein
LLIIFSWLLFEAVENYDAFSSLAKVSLDVCILDVILLRCRSGRCSDAAAEAASKVGFKNVFNVIEGFEGETGNGQRGFSGGWRSYDLPWVQD